MLNINLNEKLEAAKALRLEQVRQSMESEALDAVLVCSPENIFYLSGFTGSAGVLLLTRERACLFVDFRYAEQAAQQAPGCERIELTAVRSESVTESLRERNGLPQNPKHPRVGLEDDYLNWRLYEEYRSLLSDCEVVGFSGALIRQRQIKDAWEIDFIQEAAALTDRGFAYILQEIKPGKTEREIALALEFALRDWGAEGCSFDFIVASGPRSSMPHAAASARVLQRGDFVTLDFGVKYGGYCSDLTRTVCIGEPTSRQREIYDIVLAAQKAGLQALRAGKTGREVDACARAVIAEAGYGACFGHGLGHAVGLSVHEEPYLNERSQTKLSPGMVVTVEPGIYIPGWGGVRIEDMAVVTENEARVLTQAAKEFIIIG